MSNHVSHAALPYPIKGARFSMLVPLLDADGDPTAQTTPDTELSKDNAAAADTAEEVSATSGMDGMGLITFTGAETDCSAMGVNFKAASGPKATLATLYPMALASIGTGTLSAGSAGGGTLGALLAYDVTGCFLKTTGGTGGGGTGGANNQARRIVTYNTSTGAFTVEPNWETTPDNTTTYSVLLPDGVTLGMLKALNSTSPIQTAGDIKAETAAVKAKTDLIPAAPASTTNITAGTITTTTNLTNLPSIPAGWLTAAGIADGALTAAKFAAGAFDAVWSVAARTLTSFGSLVADIATAVWSATTRVVTAGTNIVLAKGVGVTGFNDISEAQANAQADQALADAGVTSARMGYLENANVGGNLASSSEVTAIQNNTRVVRVVPSVIERPDSSTIEYRVELFLYDTAGNMEAPDSAPTIALVNQAGTDRTSRLDSTTMALVETGRYRAVYTADVGHALEQLVWTFSVVEGGATRKYGNASLIVDTTAVDYTSSDRTRDEAAKVILDAISAKLPSKSKITGTDNSDGDVQASEMTGNFPGSVASVVGDVGGKVLGGGGGTITGTGVRAVDSSGNAIASASSLATTDAKVDTVSAGVTTLLSRITSSIFAGMTSLAQWLGLIAGKQTGNSTARTEIRATGAGSGTFDETTDSIQAIRDRGDAAWLTGEGGEGGGFTEEDRTLLEETHSKAQLITADGIDVANGSHVSADGAKLTISQGEAYLDALDNAISFTIVDTRLPSSIGTSDGTTVHLRIQRRQGGEALSLAGSIVSFNNGTKTAVVEFEMTAAQSAALPAGIASCRYEIDWLIAGDDDQVLSSIIDGICNVRKNIA